MLAWLAWHGNGEKKFLVGFYFFLAVATLAKGPVAPLLAGLIIVLFAVAQRELRILTRTLWWPGVLIFVAVAAPWYLLVQARNPQFFNQFFLQHNLALNVGWRFRHISNANLYHNNAGLESGIFLAGFSYFLPQH